MGVPTPVFIGFRVKQVEPAAAWHAWRSDLSLSHIVEICSVSECAGKAPPNWENRWDFNRFCCYNSEAEALATIPPEAEAPYGLFAYRIYTLKFDKGGTCDIDLGQEFPPDAAFKSCSLEPDLSSYVSIGHDVAGGPVENRPEGRVLVLGFGCSPLSCNGCRGQFNVNRYCLIDDPVEAIRAGDELGRTAPERCEPGPFYLYEVLRKRSDAWTAEPVA